MKKTIKAFPLSLLSLSVLAGIAQANEQTAELSLITVNGNAVSTVVNDKQIDRRVVTDLKQTLKDQIGVSISGGNGVAQFYNIRNIGEDKINLEVDGTTNTGTILHHQGRFMLDPSFIKVIEVEKGTGLASAGIGALAGVVRVTTVDAKDLLKEGQPVGLKIGATFSSNRGVSQNVAAYANQNGFDALFSGSFVQDGNYKDGNGDKAYGSKINQSNYLAKLGYDFDENNRVRASLRQEYHKGRRLPVVEFAYDPTKPEAVGESDSAQRQRTVNVEYQGKNLGIFSQVNLNAFRTQVDDYKPPKAKAGLTNDSTLMELTKVITSGANVNLASNIGSHTLKYGFNYRHEIAKPSVKKWFTSPNGATVKTDERKIETAGYLEAIWDLDPVTLTTGVRYDYFKYRDNQGGEASHGQLNPSLSAIYSVTPNFALTATASQASRSPRLNEALLINEGFVGTHVDKNIKPETARRGEVGFKWDYEGFSLSANVFQQNIKDLVIFNKKEKTIYNDGELKMRGYEAEASYANGGLKVRAAVSHAKPHIYSSAFKSDTYEDPYYFWNVGRQWLTSLSYQFENPRLELGWTGRYFERVKFVGRNGHTEKPGYGVHDISLNWQPLNNDTLNVNLGVNNVFNKYYRSQAQRGNTGFYERGREFVAGFNYRF